jgi:hypothetical protein
MPGGPRLSRTQEKAIAALLAEGTIQNAAARAKISLRTLTFWLKQPDFAAAYRAARQQVVEAAIGTLQAATSQAVDCLIRNLSCGRPGAEIAAAHHLLEKSLQAVEQFDVLSRLEALEAQAALQQGASHAYRDAQTNGEASRGPGGR